ncbi:MAG: SusE domain-containing protein [Proteiniphilum sp.]|jgi:predicted alpha-1,6-mannanase (GH76 family)|nr:SusE domain-containing protein [Proteiniphilum sp.]
MKKELYYLVFSLTVAGLLLSCSDPIEEEEDLTEEIAVNAVEKLIAPADNTPLELTKDLPAIKFEWLKADATKGGKGVTVNYEIIFYTENGSPSEPVYTSTATTNSIVIIQPKLYEIAVKAGIEPGSGGIVKWTVRAYYGSVSALSKEAGSIVLKLREEPVTQLFLTGRGTEFGTNISEAMPFVKISDTEFYTVSQLTAGEPFSFTGNIEGDKIRSFSVKNNKLVEDGSNAEIAKTGVYRIRVDFATLSVVMKEITDVSLFYCIRSRAISLRYAGRGKWKEVCLIYFSKEAWGDEKRYKFRMTEENKNIFLEKVSDSSPFMKESVIVDQGNQLWSGVWGYPAHLGKEWAEVSVDLCNYTHSIEAVSEDFSTAGASWANLADRSSSDFVKGFWNSGAGHFNNSISGAVNANDYWPEAHALDVIIDACIRTNGSRYRQIIHDFYDGVKTKNHGSWKNNYYDDMAWHGLAHLRAFEATNDARYEASARDLWRWILAGWDYAGDGGIRWRETPASGPGVPSTGPATIIGVRRWVKYGNTETGLPDGLNDLEWAKRMYEWMREKRHDPATGGVYDGFEDRTGAWSYNTGTFLGSAMELYDVTKEWRYLEDAMRTADWTLDNLSVPTKNNRILSDWAEQPDNDVNLFKGIFIRYFTRLIMNPDLPADKRNEYIRFIEYNAKALISYGSATGERDVLIYNYGWYFKPENSFLRGQTSGCMLIEAMALLEREGFLR